MAKKWSLGLILLLASAPVLAQEPSQRAKDLQLDQEVVRKSPVLSRWLVQTPNLLEEIDRTPAFPTSLRVTVAMVPSRQADVEWTTALQDIFLADTALTISTEYGQSFSTENRQWGGNLRYYLLPLGSHLNVAPVVGYRSVVVDGLTFQGTEVGTRLVIAAPQAADISLLQTFVLSDQGSTVGRTQLSFGYALSTNIRLSAQLLWQNSLVRRDIAYGLSLELVSY